MRTIGAIIKEARLGKKYSKSKLEKETKIKKEFISALEGENWERLPEPPVVQGFIKNIANALDLNSKEILAIFRRDYPPKSLRINPKPDISEGFRWSPKLTFLTGILLVSLFIFGYLIFQYINFIRPPLLRVDKPVKDQLVKTESIEVSGVTDGDAAIKVNNQPVIVEDNGTFSTEIEVSKETDNIEVKATSRSGKETIVKRNIKVELNN